jgi:hypothetical protein
MLNRKLIYIIIIGFLSLNIYANDFQSFENQYNIGFEFSQIGLINGKYNNVNISQQSLNIEIEHLFVNDIWLDANLNNVINYSQPDLGPSYLNGGGGQRNNNQAYAFGQNPFMNSYTLKGGYSFLLSDKMQLLPYIMFGRNANWSASTIVANGYNNIGVDYFYTGGVGFRFGYLVNRAIMLYVNQLYSYNWDNSGAIKSIQTLPQEQGGYGKSYAATNYQFTTTLGFRYNINDLLQIGLSAYYNNYQHQSNISGIVYIPQHTFGETLSLGFIY